MSRFGKTAKVGWLPDDFGHVSQLPQLLRQSGINYFYFMRCHPYTGTFWWMGSDISKVLCYSNDGYGNSITPSVKNDLQTVTPGKHRLLYPTGVGDHGGGPTRADINNIHYLNGTPKYPAIKFTTAEEFFRKASGEMDGRPVHKGEMRIYLSGMLHFSGRDKKGDRNCENALYGSEFFSSLRWLQGDVYPAEKLHDPGKQLHSTIP